MAKNKSVLHAMLQWSETQDPWVLDALGRIFRGDQITNADITRYVTSLLSDQPPEGYKPLSEGELPTSLNGRENVSLVSIGNLEGINRMAAGYILEFGPGLTVVYGTNGAGKSGYCRVLKKACRSRGSCPEILGDMLSNSSCEQKATIKFRTENGVVQAAWDSNQVGSSILGNAFVFDSATAQNYVSASDKASFTPFGLDILPKLVPVMDQVQASLVEQKNIFLTEIDTLVRTLRFELHTEPAKYIASLGAKSDKAKLERLISLSEQDLERKRLLVDLLNKDPSIEAEKTKNAKARVQTFIQKMNTVLSQLSPSNILMLEDLRKSIFQAREATRAFREQQYQSAVLPGTGDADTWRPLWDAASEFSIKCAYALKAFPFVESNALCVFCQNPLAEAGKVRMLDFQASVEAKEERDLAAIEIKIRGIDQTLKFLPSVTTELKTIMADLEVGISSEIDNVTMLALGIDQQIAHIRLGLQDSEALAIAELDLTVLGKLADYVESLNTLETTQRKAMDPEGRKAFQSELTELHEREKLAVHHKSILQIIEDYRKVSRIEALIRETKTANVTKFYGQLASDWITEPFRQNLNIELDKLGLTTIRPVLESVNSKGQVYYTLSLREGISQKLVNIASEGEQRCIALAGFLAELGQASHRSAILFDDPVSSLDHLYQNRVAERLSLESTERQVIVFTHDIVFLQQLLRWQEHHEYEPTVKLIEWDGKSRRPGAVSDQLPWNVQSVKQQIHHLKEIQRQLTSSWVPIPTEGNNRDMEHAYSLLRSAIERSVEETMFSGIVERFNDQILVGKVLELAELPEDMLISLKELYSECHKVVDAHTKPQLAHPTPPDPIQLDKDILTLEAICARVRDHRKQRSQHA